MTNTAADMFPRQTGMSVMQPDTGDVIRQILVRLDHLERHMAGGQGQDMDLLTHIHGLIGTAAFTAVDVVARAETEPALAEALSRHRVTESETLGRCLSALSRRPATTGAYHLAKIKRSVSGWIYSIEQNDADDDDRHQRHFAP